MRLTFRLLFPAALVVATACQDERLTEPASTPILTNDAELVGSTTDIPEEAPVQPEYVRDPIQPELEGAVGAHPRVMTLQSVAGSPIVRVYQDEMPWFGANRAHTTLLGLGKTLGVDYFIHPLDDLATGIPAGTNVVVLTSNSSGQPSQAIKQNSALSQAALLAFLRTGGRLIVDMGDNLFAGGFIAPGALGTPTLIHPSPCENATLAPAAPGHAMVIGPDRIAGTTDDWNNANIDLVASCSVAHGNLVDGLTLPEGATVLMTAVFSGVAKPIMAEYCYEGGRVILDTNTKEFPGQQPVNQGLGIVMRNLFEYALSDASSCQQEQSIEFGPLPVRTFGDPDVEIGAVASSGLPVTFLASGACSLSSPTTVHLDGAGECTITAQQAGNASYLPTEATASFEIRQATPVLEWATPAPIVLGTPLGSAQLNATALGVGGVTLSGTFAYAPAAGVVLPVGEAHELSVQFTPADPNYTAASKTVIIAVHYAFSGFGQPVDNNVLNKAKAGSAIPVKFSLAGNQGLAILSAGSPSSTGISCGTAIGEDLIEEVVAASNSGLTYDAAADQYIYVWKTSGTWAGTCRKLVVSLIDGTRHEALFHFVK